MGVIEHQVVGILRQAGNLLRTRLVKALLIEAHVQASSEKRGMRLQLLRVRAVSVAKGLEIFLQALAVKAGLLQILRGTNECPRLSPHGCAKRAECPASFWSKKDECFFRFRRHDDKHAFIVNGTAPGLDPGEP